MGAAGALLLALAATAAAQRFRMATRNTGSDLRLTLALLGLAILRVPLALFVASLFGLTGA